MKKFIKGQLRGSVEETLKELLEAKADKLTQAARYERNEQRQGYRSGHYSRNLTTTSGNVTLKVSKLKGIPFETAIIERYRHRESSVGEVFPEAKYQRCTVHFYRNVFSVTPRSKVKLMAKRLKAIHAYENKKAAREKAKAVVEELKEAAKKAENCIEETLTYCDFPSEHWTRIRTNNVIEWLNREIRRRTRVVGSFPDCNSAPMLV